MTDKTPPEHISHFNMVDVGEKRPTRRTAIAGGTIILGEKAFLALRQGTLPKGNVLALAEIAAITGAKKTPDMVPLCHSIPLDMVEAHFALDDAANSVHVFVHCVATAKTGVEMEALAGVHAALMTIWDLTKGTTPDLCITGIRLLVKMGGKSGVWKSAAGIPAWLEKQLPSQDTLCGQKVCVLVMSDRAAQGVYQDTSGAYLVQSLKSRGADVSGYEVVADESGAIKDAIARMHATYNPALILTSGGTGPGPRDITPEILGDLCARTLDGLGEWLRHESLYFTQTAWLSRMMAGMLDDTLIIALPGSLKAVQECWQILVPVLPTALQRIHGQRQGA